MRVNTISLTKTPLIGAALALVLVASNAKLALATTEIDLCSTAEVHQERVEACTAVLQSGSESERAEALFNRGESYYRHGQSRACFGEPEEMALGLTDLNEARQLNPKKPEAHLYVGHIYASRGDFENALSAYDRAAKADRTDAEVYRFRAKVYSQLGQVDTAYKDYQRTFRFGGAVVVKWMQGELNALSLYDGPQDGTLNRSFRASLKSCIAQKLC